MLNKCYDSLNLILFLGAAPPPSRPAPPPPATHNSRYLLHLLLSEPRRVDSLFSFLSPNYPLKKKNNTHQQDSTSLSPPSSPLSPPAFSRLVRPLDGESASVIPEAVTITSLRVIQALLDSSSPTLDSRKRSGFCRDGVNLEMIVTSTDWKSLVGQDIDENAGVDIMESVTQPDLLGGKDSIDRTELVSFGPLYRG